MTNSFLDDPQSLLTELCRQDFTAFLRKAWPWVSGGDLLDWNWHFDAMAHKLEQIADGELQRSIINIPPRNGKSKTISVIWVAFMLGLDPTKNFVCVSYSSELSNKFARDCRSIIESQWYRQLFPGTILSKARSAAYDFETTRGGGRLATSIGGTLTGRGGDIIILDDVIKPSDAHSETVRTNVNDWFSSTLSSRLDNKKTGSMICVMQRLHEHDLCGMLIEQGGWDCLSIPSIAIEDEYIMLARVGVYHRREGELLHADREPMEVLDDLKRSMGSYAFEAQYQQQPMPSDGNLIKAAWLKESGPDIENQPGHVVQSWDTAIKTGSKNDYSVCITARLFRNEIHVIDVYRGRVEFPDLLKKTKAMARQFGAQTLLIEDKASGQQLIQSLRASHDLGVPNPIARTPETDKFIRAAGVSSMVEAGQLYLPRDAHWLADFKKELLGFPSGKHDDQVDALSQLLEWSRTSWKRRSRLGGRPILIYTDEFGETRSSEDGRVGGYFSRQS
jgi:predicted phage terminase large subunit-like protein